MKDIHNKEKEQFEKLFKEKKIDNIDDRFKVLDVFLENEKHLTVNELLELAEKKGYYLTLSFVEDTLKFMCHFGFANKNRFDDGEIRYEHKHLGLHHDHIICIKCQKIIEFNDEKLETLQIKIAAAKGFYMLQHRMELYGICSDCFKKRSKIIPLSMAKSGERLIIKEIAGGAKMTVRILTMGLKAGDRIEVITNYGRGEMVIAADFNRIVIGRGVAEKIFAEPLN